MKNKLYYFSLLLLLVIPNICFAQKETTNWYFGDRVGISFQSGVPIPLNDGKLNSTEGCAVMSDRLSGKLLFYTDGSTIWNANHEVVNNGNGLLGGSSGTQTVLIIPNPGNGKEYYIFTVPDLTTSTSPLTTSMFYSFVSVANPAVDVVFKNKKLLDGVSEKLTGTLDCSGKGYWVVTHHKVNNEFYSYHITNRGVDTTPVISQYSEISIDHTAGYLRISPNRSKLAIASHNASSFLALFDFNPSTGVISNYNRIGNPAKNDKFYGVSFSPDNTKLYAIGKSYLSTTYESALFQFEVNLLTPDQIKNSIVVFPVRAPVTFVAAIEIAMDNKLYLASTYRNYLDVIHNPNLKGNLCNYQADAVKLPRQCLLGLPNFINYNFLPLSNKDSILVDCKDKNILIGTPSNPNETYHWEPSTGLNNPILAQPTVIINKPITYTRTTTNSNGCITIDSVSILFKSSLADAGKDRTICINDSTIIGTSPLPGHTYSWFPTQGLNNPTTAQPIAKPLVTTSYILTATSSTGCSNSDTIQVVVNPLVPLSFKLSPDTIQFIPDQHFRVELNIPKGVFDWHIRLTYNPFIVQYDTILQLSNGIQVPLPQEINTGQLLINGKGDNGKVLLDFKGYLPHTTDSVFSIIMTVDSVGSLPCSNILTTNTTIRLGDYCAKYFRAVNGTGNSFFLTSTNQTIDFGVGLACNVRLEVYDYRGSFSRILVDQALLPGLYSTTLDLPVGLYFCRMRAGLHDFVEKVIVVR